VWWVGWNPETKIWVLTCSTSDEVQSLSQRRRRSADEVEKFAPVWLVMSADECWLLRLLRTWCHEATNMRSWSNCNCHETGMWSYHNKNEIQYFLSRHCTMNTLLLWTPRQPKKNRDKNCAKFRQIFHVVSRTNLAGKLHAHLQGTQCAQAAWPFAKIIWMWTT